MSALIVDTSSWISYFAGRGSSLIDTALEESRIHLPAIVAAELLSGKLNAAKRAELESLLNDVPLCEASLSHWFRVGTLRSRLLAKGISVSTPDAHIAQCAIDLDAELLTEDAIFRLIARREPLRLVSAAANGK